MIVATANGQISARHMHPCEEADENSAPISWRLAQVLLVSISRTAVRNCPCTKSRYAKVHSALGDVTHVLRLPAVCMVRHFFVFEFAVEIIAFFLTFIYILPIFLQMLIDLPVHVPEPAPTT